MIRSNKRVLNGSTKVITTITNNTQEKGMEEMIHKTREDFYIRSEFLLFSSIPSKSFRNVGFHFTMIPTCILPSKQQNLFYKLLPRAKEAFTTPNTIGVYDHLNNAYSSSKLFQTLPRAMEPTPNTFPQTPRLRYSTHTSNAWEVTLQTSSTIWAKSYKINDTLANFFYKLSLIWK